MHIGPFVEIGYICRVKSSASVICIILLLFCFYPLMGRQNMVVAAKNIFPGKSAVLTQNSAGKPGKLQGEQRLHLPASAGETITVPSRQGPSTASRISSLLLITQMNCKGYSCFLFTSEPIPAASARPLHKQFVSFPHHHFW